MLESPKNDSAYIYSLLSGEVLNVSFFIQCNRVLLATCIKAKVIGNVSPNVNVWDSVAHLGVSWQGRGGLLPPRTPLRPKQATSPGRQVVAELYVDK